MNTGRVSIISTPVRISMTLRRPEIDFNIAFELGSAQANRNWPHVQTWPSYQTIHMESFQNTATRWGCWRQYRFYRFSNLFKWPFESVSQRCHLKCTQKHTQKFWYCDQNWTFLFNKAGWKVYKGFLKDG